MYRYHGGISTLLRKDFIDVLNGFWVFYEARLARALEKLCGFEVKMAGPPR